ncbi:MAG: pyridoxamine 5'-phosphate oxidase family protein [Chloroflexi bacterium]|nr:pyridoxamine 5'-phosphate oxidase family protein [Chloroflexota bacterium]
MQLSPEVRAFLQTPFIARLSVIDPNGFPHTVPLWFDVEGDDIIIISDRNTKKIPYIDANPKACICVGGGETADGVAGPGYLFKGEAFNEEDPGFYWLRRMTLRYEQGEKAEQDIELWRTTLDMMIIRFKVQKVSKVA